MGVEQQVAGPSAARAGRRRRRARCARATPRSARTAYRSRLARRRGGAATTARPVRRAPSRAHPLDEVGRDAEHERAAQGHDAARARRRRAPVRAPEERRCAGWRRRARGARPTASTATAAARSPWACTTSAPPTSRAEVAHGAGVTRRVRAVGELEGHHGRGDLVRGRSGGRPRAGTATTTWWPAAVSDPTSPCTWWPTPPALVPSTTSTLIPGSLRGDGHLPRWRTCDIISPVTDRQRDDPDDERPPAPAAAADEHRLEQVVDRRPCVTRSPDGDGEGDRDDERAGGAAGALGDARGPRCGARAARSATADTRHAEACEPMPSQRSGRRRAAAHRRARPAAKSAARLQPEAGGQAGVGRPAAHVQGAGSAGR